MEGSWNSKKRITSGENHQALIKATTSSEGDTSSNSEVLDESKRRGNKFCIDHSLNGKAKCRECKNVIAKDELRIGKHVPYKEIHIIQYYHLSCAFTTFKRARVLASVISNVTEIDGMEGISLEERMRVEDMIREFNSGRNTPLPEEESHKKPSAKGSGLERKTRSLKSSNIPAMRILFTNADQLTTSKMAELQVKAREEKPHIIAVSEIKLKNPKKE